MSELTHTHAHHEDHAHGHAHDHDEAHAHAHGYNSFLDRWWQVFVIGLGCVGVFVLTHYNPVR